MKKRSHTSQIEFENQPTDMGKRNKQNAVRMGVIGVKVNPRQPFLKTLTWGGGEDVSSFYKTHS